LTASPPAGGPDEGGRGQAERRRLPHGGHGAGGEAVSHIRRRLDRLEQSRGGATPFADLPDAEVLAAMAQVAVEVSSWPHRTVADADLLGPRNPRLAHLSDDQLLAEL